MSAATAEPRGDRTGPAPLLTIADLHVHRGDAHVLHGLTFDVPANRVTALLGRNGAGKTTTLLALLGLLPAVGSVRLEGEELVGQPPHRTVQRGIGYVPEDREVFSQLSVEENLRLAARTPEAAQRLALVHDVFPVLADRRRQAAGTLSGGQQQMLAIARALLNPNRLLLVDEPSKGLAPSVIDDVVAALQRASTDTTILLVEQNLAVARRLSTEAVVLDQGTVVFDGTSTDLFADPDLTERYLGVASATPTPAGRSGAEPTAGRSHQTPEGPRP